MAKQSPRAREDGPSEAEKLIDLLGQSGTGKDKLDVARQVLKDEEEGEAPTAEDVVTHLKRNNTDDKLAATIAKAEAFIKDGLKPQVVVEPPFVPNATAPGTVPQANVRDHK